MTSELIWPSLILCTLKLPFERGEWCDADERIFQACFTILRQFVEDELGTEQDDYRGYRLHSADIEPEDPSGLAPRRSSDKDAIDLWLWYRDELPKLEADYAQDISECFSGEWKTQPVPGLPLREITDFGKVREPKFPYDYPEIVKDKKLRELIELRCSLWT